MKQQTQNTFHEGMMKDLNPITTPNTVLTDALNATIITYNGTEFVLQNDMGNCKVERARLTPGFIPVGMKEYGGIIYVTSLNPETRQCEVGCFPSPERDFTTSDFENLTPAKFQTSDYTVNTGGEVNERTSVITKLVEPELMQLNPGDKYLVTYTIHDPSVGSAADEIDNKTKMDEYISKDAADRKLFRLRFYKITDDNNLSEINADDVNLVDINSDLENEYVFFKEKNKGVIAVGLALETLDSFDINVVDTSRRTEEDKSAVIEAVGFSDSLADFEGVRVDITEPSTSSFFINKTSDVRKVSANITELIADSKLVGSITPYSKYALYPKLKKDFNLELGKYASTGSGINNIYRYYQGTDYVKVDFDFKFEGNNSNGLTLYVEFYDPWSDYSVVKVVDNPTYYGINSVVMQLIDEPTTEVFDSNQRGGTATSKLITNTDTTYLKTMLSSSYLIRTTSVLRKDHFYIVRISGVDVDVTQDPTEYTHYDLYKGLYTNTMFNDTYLAQNSLSEGTPGYVSDFNTLDFDLSAIKFSVAASEVSNINAVPVVTTQRDDLITAGKYYKISSTPLSTTLGYKHTKLYKNNRKYSLKLTLTGIDKIFGDFREELVTVSIPTLHDSNSSSTPKPTIVDQNYDLDATIAPNSFADWEISQIDSRNYQLDTETTTKRSVYAAVESATLTTNVYKEVSMSQQFYYMPNSTGPFAGNRAAVAKYSKYQLDIRKTDGSVHTDTTSGHAFDDGDINSTLGGHLTTTRPYTAAILATSQERTWFYTADGYWDCASNDPSGTAAWKQSIMWVRKDNGEWRATRTHDLTTMKDFWGVDTTDPKKGLKVASNVSAVVNTYYPTQDIKVNQNVSTVVTYPTFNVVTNFNPTSPGIPTYLSKVIFKATSSLKVNFTTALVNGYIATRLGDSIIVDGKDEIRDGFIPYITATKQTVDTVTVSPTVITQSGDNAIVTKMAAGENQVATDSSLTPGRYPHGKVFTDDPNYQSYIPMFTVQGAPVTSGTEITPTNVQIRIQNAGGEWIGKNSRVGRCDGGDNAIDLIPNIMIIKT